jgi:hypothetical protein
MRRRRYSRSPRPRGDKCSRLRTLGRLRGNMKGLAVMCRRTLEISLHDQADEADQDQDEHRRGSDQRNRQDRAPDLSFARFLHLEVLRHPQKPRTAGVGGVLGAPTCPASDELAGISEDAATKSDTQIWFGRASPGLLIGVCWVTFVEAHPVTAIKANKKTTILLQVFVAKLPRSR